MDGNLSFNGNSLQTDNIKTEFIEHTDLPETIAEMFYIAGANESTIPSVEYTSKLITIRGTLTITDDILSGNTVSEALDILIDDFKGYFNGKDKNLDIVYGGGTRRYICTNNSIGIERAVNSKYAKFTVTVMATKPFGRDVTPTNIISETNYTSPTLTVTPTIGGSAPVQFPVFTITLDSITGDGDYVQISNDENGQSILLYGLGLENGDVLVVDCEAREVLLNDELVDYNGAFIVLEPGEASITISDGFDSRSIDIEAEYNKLYK